ncbi:MAG: DNA recombination protein RmuC [Ketobacteraceae bacterium]|nr:DNA recombination protein RmuC [Ketobacteraceae bacterium]
MNPDVLIPLALFVAGLVAGALLLLGVSAQRTRALMDKLRAEQQLERQNLESSCQHLEEKYQELSASAERAEQNSLQWQDKYHQQQNRVSQLEQQVLQLEQLENKLQEKERSNHHLQQLLKEEHGKCTQLQARLEASQQELVEKINLLKEAREQLKVEFQNIANKLFEDKSEKFTTQNKSNMEQILSPLREQLSDFKKRVEDVYDKESKERVSLLKEITQLKDINTRMSEDALKLTRALKGDTKIQGNWGEMVLERILETSGLRKGIEYETQVNLKAESGERRQPDVIVRLPENKDIVVDSKVSLVAWESYCSAEDEREKDAALYGMLQSIKDHIKYLSRKDYAHLEGIRSLDFVLMFVPVEGAFLKVLELDSEFFSEAFEKNIMVVSPSTLLVTLRTIQNIWRYEYQNRNALEIAKAAGGLHDQFILFAESLEDVGQSIGKAQSAYETAHKRLVSGRGNLVNRTLKLEKMGAKAKKKMPAALQDAADNTETEQEIDEVLESND